MNPQEVFCPNLECPTRGQKGKGNIGVQSQQGKRYICHECHQTFVARKGSIFYLLHTDPKTVLLVIALYCRYNQGYARFWKGEGVVKWFLIGGRLGISFAICAILLQ